MKFYSEELKKCFDTVDALESAEHEAKAAKEAQQRAAEEKAKNRAARAKEVEEAYVAAQDAQKKANKLMREFLNDYGTFHTSIREVIPSIWDLIW